MAGLTGIPSYRNPVDVPLEVTKAATANSEISREQFFELMIAQLRNQDPLEPMDNDKMLQQISTLQSLETNERMADGMDQLVATMNGQALNQGASMLGMIVTANTKEQVFDAEGSPVLDVNGNAVFQDASVEGLASGISIDTSGELNVTLEVPVLNSDGEPIYNSSGVLITKKVNVVGADITGIRDPLIDSATGGEEDF